MGDPVTTTIIVASVITGTAGATAGTVAAVESERAGRKANREKKREADAILARAEEEAELLREQAARAATAQRAAGGAAGTGGLSAAVLVQETLTSSFREIQGLRADAAIQATAIRKQGRSARRAAQTQTILGVTQAVAAIGGAVLGGINAVNAVSQGATTGGSGLAGIGVPTGPGTGIPGAGEVPLTGV